MRRVGALSLVLWLAACSGPGREPAAPSIGRALPPLSDQRAAARAASTQCSINNLGGSDGSYAGTGSSVNDSWFIYQPYGYYPTLIHQINGMGSNLGTYTVPSDPYSARWENMDLLAVVGPTAWITGSYANSQGVVTHYIAHADASTITTYPYGPYTIGAIAASPGGPVYFAATDTSGHLVIERFNGSGVTAVAKAPYTGMHVNSMAAFGSDAVVLLTQGREPNQNAVVAHWNGSTFAFHELQYNVGSNGDPGVQITGISPRDLWAVTSHNIYRYNGQWQPYAYVPPQYGTPQFGGVVELRSNYVIVTGSQGSTPTFAPLAYAWHGVDRFQPIAITIPQSGQGGGISALTAVPGTTNFYGNYVSQAGPGYQTTNTYGLASCPG